MPLWEHLGELRRRLTVMVVAFLVAVVVLYLFSAQLIQFLVDPINEVLSGATVDQTLSFVQWMFPEQYAQYQEELAANAGPIDLVGWLIYGQSLTGSTGSENLVALSPLTGFMVRFKVSAFFSLVVTAPIWIWQILAFFLPALKDNERKWVLPTFGAGVILFIVGTVFCYAVILSAAFEWMVAQSDGIAKVMPDVQTFIDTVLMFEICFGLAFELPMVVFYLIVFNVVPYKKLRASWRVVYVVLMVFCAIVTPDANPVTLVLMFVPMAALYELSLLFARIVLSRRIKTLASQEDEAEAAASAA
jgi:sec-independent protein translocase protein TatC